jgi:hypothetical protein
MPIGGSATEFNITGAKLKVSGGVQVSGSIAYTTDATGFGGVTAQIDGNNTLNITSGKLTGVTKIDRSTAATITAITHTNVNNNTTIHIALKNTSSNKGDFVTIGTFEDDDTVKVNYTDEYVIGPGETGMLTLRKVNGVLSLFIREMFSSTATDFDTANKPFYIKDGVNYKYPLYKSTGANLVTETIGGVTYYRPSSGLKVKSRPPKGIPENVTPPSASSFAIGNTGDLTTINYDVIGVSSNFDYGSITDGNNATHARFLLNDGEASGSFTESGASSGDTYKLFIEKTNTNLTDTVSATSTTPSTPFAVFHHGTFSDGGNPYGHADITAAATAGYFYSDTATGSYALGTLDETPTFVQETAVGGDGYGKTTYKFTVSDLTSVDHLLVGGGGGGGGGMGGGGGAGGYLETKNTTISAGQKTIVVGGGGIGGIEGGSYENRGRNGANTSVTGLTTAIGGGGGASGYDQSNLPAGNGGSGGGGSGGKGQTSGNGGERGTGTAGQGFDGANSGNHWYPAGGGGASEKGYGRDGTGGNNHIAHGGDGKQSTITGFTSYYFSGGGGGAGHTTSAGNGGKGGGGGGANDSTGSHGTGNTDGLTNGENGDDGTNSNSQEPPANTAGGAGGKHTGGGGGGGDHHQYNWGGVGGSGIVIIRTGGTITTGKTIPKVTDIVLDPTNESNVLISTQGTGISTVTYSVNSGSEVSTPVSQLSVAHGLAEATTGILLAYALDASSARLGVKLSKSITTPYGYETITLLSKSGSQTIVYVDNGTTNVTNTYKSTGGNTWNGGWYMDTGYTAPVTFEYNASASSSDDSNSYKQIGISDSESEASEAASSNNMDMYHYAYYQSAFHFQGTDVTDEAVATPWNSTDTFYIVYKTNGDVEWWQAGTKIKTVSWGVGKTVYLSARLHKQSNGSDNGTFKNIRIKRREWDGTKYIN